MMDDLKGLGKLGLYVELWWVRNKSGLKGYRAF